MSINSNSKSQGLKAYFSSSLFPGVGGVAASKIVAALGKKAHRRLMKKPSRIKTVEGLGPKQTESVFVFFNDVRNTDEEEAELFIGDLMACGLTESMAQKTLSDKSVDIEEVLENPYVLTSVNGIGFYKADMVARYRGIAKLAPIRIEAAIKFILEQAAWNDGHCNLPARDLLAKCCKILDVDPTEIAPLIKEAILDLEAESQIVTEKGFIYLKWIYEKERRVAQKIWDLTRHGQHVVDDPSVERAIAKSENVMQINFTEEQEKAIYSCLSVPVSIITGRPGTGKCLAPGTPVMMSDGSIKPVENIVVGDTVMGPDSSPRTVTGTTSGIGKMYRVVPVKGDPYEVNENHVLSLKMSGGRNHGELINIPVKDYLRKSKHFKHCAKGWRTKVRFAPGPDLPIDPYFLGLWLGDGTEIFLGISNPDIEIIQWLKSYARSLNLGLRKSLDETKCPTWTITSGPIKTGDPRSGRNPLLTEMQALNLIGNKHIPYQYLTASRKNRLRLLSGLIDTDGHLRKNGGGYEIVSKHKALAEGILFLARSLGLAAYSTRCTKSCQNNFSGKYERISISGHVDILPCKVRRKQSGQRRQKKDALKTGIKVESLGMGKYFGFQLSGDGLFLLGDFTITHNSTVVQGVVSICRKKGVQIGLACPTGRARKRLQDVVGHNAYTIHRLLKWTPTGFVYGPHNPLPYDVVLIDEFSMVDLALFARVLDAMPEHGHIVMVGDAHQLPSVGPGNVLRDLIASKRCKVLRLTKIFRHKEGSDIAKNAAMINRGRLPKLSFSSNRGFSFVETHNRYHITETITEIYEEMVEKSGPHNVQVLSPMHKGSCGTIALNEALQKIANPEGRPVGLKRSGYDLRTGDRVLVTRNDYQYDIFNGDVGTLLGVNQGRFKSFEIEFTGGRTIDYPVAKMSFIEPGWCVSIHKAQGGEHEAVICAVSTEHYKLLDRNLLYTAVTRASSSMILVGQRKAVFIAVKTDNAITRNTGLTRRLRNEIPKGGTGNGKRLRGRPQSKARQELEETLF